jgi:hypothetical protein
MRHAHHRPVVDDHTGEVVYERVHGEEGAALELAARLAGGGRRVRVPLAAATLSEAGFLEHLLDTVRRHHAEPRLITIEIAGPGRGGDPARVRRVTRALFACRFTCEA